MFKTTALDNVGNEYVDKNVGTSTPGTRLEADDRNVIQRELVDLVESSGQTLKTSPDLTVQAGIAAARYGGGGGSYYVDSGVANAYVLLRLGTFKDADAYFDGMTVIFAPSNDNTGASTINVGGLGVVDLKNGDGGVLIGGEIKDSELLTCVYLLGAFRVVLQDAEQTPFDDTSASITATNVQDAIEELDDKSPTEDYILIEDQKASGTDGGGMTSGSWQTRDLTTKVIDTGSHVGLSSNQIGLAAGTYRFRAEAMGGEIHEHKVKLINITDTIEYIGTSARSDTVTAYTVSTVTGRFTIASTKTFELQHRCAVTRGTDGRGKASGFGVVEVYARVELWREVD